MQPFVRTFVAIAILLVGAAVRADQPAIDHRSLVKMNDGVLWIGDEQMERADWPRFVITGLLQARDDDGVRWSRAGLERSSAADASIWAGRLTLTLRASLIFASFGHEDGGLLRSPMPQGFENPTDADLDAALSRYDDGLKAMVEALRSRRVRTVVLFGPAAVDELEPAGAGVFVGYNATLRAIADRAKAFAERESLPFIDLHSISSSVYERMRAAGAPATQDGRTPTEAASVLIAAEVLDALGVSREALGELNWRPSSEPTYSAARAIDPSLPEIRPGDGAPSFAITQALRVYDAHWDILWRDLDQGLHPDHAHRAEILSLQRAEVDADWRRVRVEVEEARAADAP